MGLEVDFKRYFKGKDFLMKKHHIILSVYACGFIAGIFFFGTNTLALDDVDVMIKYDVIADKDNAYIPLNEAGEKLNYPEGELWNEIISGEEWDDDYVKKILDKNSKVFALYEKGLAMDKIQAPPPTRGIRTIIPYVFKWRNLALTLSVKSEHEFRNGNQDEAFDTALNIVRFGQKVTLAKGCLLNQMIGLVIQDIGLKKICQFTNKSKLSKKKAREYISRLSDYGNTRRGMISAYKVEYLMYVYEIQKMRHATYIYFIAFVKSLSGTDSIHGEIEVKDFPEIASMEVASYFDIEKTKEFSANYTRELIKLISAEYYSEADRANLKVMSDYISEDYKKYKPENYFGRIFNMLMLRSISMPVKKVFFMMSRIETAKALIALNVYKQDKCYLPDSLNELVPVYIDRVPIDYFTGEPISISVKEEILYFDNEYLDYEQTAAEENKVKINF